MLPIQRPANWLLSVLNISAEEFMSEYSDLITESQQDTIELTLLKFEISDDPNVVMSAITSLCYYSSKSEENYDIIMSIINGIQIDRWVDLFAMRDDIIIDCIKLFALLTSPPMKILDSVGEYIINNEAATHQLIEVWIDMNWDICIDMVYVVQHSQYGWKLLTPYVRDTPNSNILIGNIFDDIENDIDRWLSFCMLLNVNGSTLDLLMMIDREYADGLETTFQTIEELQLWDTIIGNPSAEPIIDYALDNYDRVLTGKFKTREALRKWIVKNLDASPLVQKYVLASDITDSVVYSTYYQNPFAIGMISNWVDINGMTPHAMENIINTAACEYEQCAATAIDVLFKNIKTQRLEQSDWSKLLCGKYSQSRIIEYLSKTNKAKLLTLLHQESMLPYWDDDCILRNLNKDTVSFIKYDHDLMASLSRNVYYIQSCDWKVLFKSELGVAFAMQHINVLVEFGTFADLIKSPFVTIEHILQIDRNTPAFEYYDDEEFIAVINRSDAFTLDKKKYHQERDELHLELLTFWHNPDRIVEQAKRLGTDFYSYLQMM
jgi:hypothetical protein